MDGSNLDKAERVTDDRGRLEEHRVMDLRLGNLRFTLGFLGAMSIVSIGLTLTQSGPWINGVWGAGLVVLSLAFFAIDRRFSYYRRECYDSHSTGGAVDGDSRKIVLSSVIGGWPISCIYFVFVIFGAFYGTLPIWMPQPKSTPAPEIPAVKMAPLGFPQHPDRVTPLVTPISRPPIGIIHTPPPRGQ